MQIKHVYFRSPHRTVNFNGLLIDLCKNERFIAVDSDGHVYAYIDQPEFNATTQSYEVPERSPRPRLIVQIELGHGNINPLIDFG